MNTNSMQGKDHKVAAAQEEYCFHSYSNRLNFETGCAVLDGYRPNSDFNSGLDYTFLPDMLSYFPWYSGEKLLSNLKGYEDDMLKKFCKKDPKAFEVMLFSLNMLGWLVYGDVDEKKDIIAKWAFDEYNRLALGDWNQYVSEDDICSILYNLD